MGYLRGLADEFGESSNAIRVELNRFESAGLLVSMIDGNKKIYQANSNHPLFPEIQSLVLKYVGIDRILKEVIAQTDEVKEIWIVSVFNLLDGNQNPILLLVGNNLDVEKIQNIINQPYNQKTATITVATISINEIKQKSAAHKDKLLIWQAENHI
jgi:hypothetical protein